MLRVVEQASLTDVGRQRNANEDALFEAEGVALFAVADGMGGARAGEVAAGAAVEELSGLTGEADIGEGQLASAVEQANRRIHELSQSDESLSGMGTTMTTLAVRDAEVAIAHVGDSRAYRLREGELDRLTHDHSLVDEMVRAGKLTPEEAEVHPQRSIITRALGPEPEVEVERLTHPARPGDVYLVCSDGLTTMLPEDAIGAILGARSSLAEAAEALVRAANEAGGRDNITVVLFRLGDEDEPAPEPEAEHATMVGALRVEEVQAAAEEARAKAAPAAGSTMIFDESQRARLREAQGAREPKPPPRPVHRRRRWVTVLLMALVVGAVGTGFWAGSRQFYFVGTDDRGLVALYRGLPYELPLGVELFDREYSTAVPARMIPKTRRERILDHRLRGRGDAVDLIKRVERGELEG
jgi:protein phosphatase